MSYNRNNNYGDRDTLYTQAPPMAKSPSSNSPYYDDPRMTREWNGRDEYDDDRSYRSPPPPNNNNYDRQSEYYDDQPPYQQPYSRYDTISSPPPLTSSTISSSASQAYRPTPPNSSSPSPARGYNGNAPQRRAPATNPGQNRSAPPGFKIEGGALVPIVPRGSSHPTEIFYQPPKKVIRAMESYNARSANELTFVKGDFFYVVSDFERHYEVVNPLEKTRGIVPKSCFEGLEEMQARTLANARAAAGIEVGVVLSTFIQEWMTHPHLQRHPSQHAASSWCSSSSSSSSWSTRNH
ncbi:hypothetical protein BC829DRAFT_189322 [Chytridium lagenaria]|nr:hypothetical protein BC829DRAFT_189322 [Chytridium lagenaria]